MPTSCAAYGCTIRFSKESQEKGISFHYFPVNDKRRLKLWLVNMRRKNFKPTLNTRICSEHFLEDDFEYQPFTNRRQLKSTAVPTKFCFVENEEQAKEQQKTACKYQIIQKDLYQIVNRTPKVNKATQTVDEFTSHLLAEIKKLKAENVELRNDFQKFDILLDNLT